MIEFGATREGAPLLTEMRRMPELLARRTLKVEDINDRLVRGSWRRLVYDQPALADGTVDRRVRVLLPERGSPEKSQDTVIGL